MSLDFNDAEPQRDFEVIPADTILPLAVIVRPGGVGEGGWETRSKNDHDVLYLDCELVVVAGPYINRKIWQKYTTQGGKVNEKGESIAKNITRSNIRAMLNSARGIKPDDDSEAARKARVLQNWGDINGLVFVAKSRIEKGTNGYKDKNQVGTILEPGHKDYSPPPAYSAPAQASAAAAAPKPSWAAGPAVAAVAAAASAPAQGNGNLPAWAR